MKRRKFPVITVLSLREAPSGNNRHQLSFYNLLHLSGEMASSRLGLVGLLALIIEHVELVS